MVSMDDRVAIGAMIHQQRALLRRCDERLAEIAREMPYAGRERRRRLRMRAHVLKRTRWRHALTSPRLTGGVWGPNTTQKEPQWWRGSKFGGLPCVRAPLDNDATDNAIP